MSHTINDLREHLFATLADLRNKDNPMDIERAKAVADVAQTIINTAKVEAEHLKVTGQTEGSGFMALENHGEDDGPGVTKDPIKGTSTTVIGSITRHKAK